MTQFLDSLPCEIAITEGDATEGDFFPAEWTRVPPAGTDPGMLAISREYRFVRVDGQVGADVDFAWIRILVGSGGDAVITNLVKGTTYNVTAGVTANPENVRKKVGTMKVS